MKKNSSTSLIWRIDLNNSKPPIEEPLGFVKTNPSSIEKADSEVITKTDEGKLLALKKKRAMDMGMSPGKSLLPTMFMLWMAGGGVHIFSIMIVGMSLVQPLRAIASMQSFFQPIEADNVDLTQPKLMYVALNLLALGIALYKCFTMGLLPLSSADWVSLIEPRHNIEISGGGLSLIS